MKFSDKGIKLTPAKIKEFENELEITLPDLYVKFLLKNNGGEPEKPCFEFSAPDGEEDSVIQCFFSVDAEDNLYDVKTNFLAMLEEEQIDKNYLPIAIDEFGNIILIGIDKEVNGKVYFWNHELQDDEDILQNIFLVADDFDLFMGKLTDLDD